MIKYGTSKTYIPFILFLTTVAVIQHWRLVLLNQNMDQTKIARRTIIVPFIIVLPLTLIYAAVLDKIVGVESTGQVIAGVSRRKCVRKGNRYECENVRV